MKSFTLSLLVAAAISLGASTALAEAPRENVPNAALASASDAANRAKVHSQNAAIHRENARKAEKKAADYTKIAEADAAHGFNYAAGVARARAAEQLAYAKEQKSLAEREEALAAKERLVAKEKMAAYQKSMGSSPASHKPPAEKPRTERPGSQAPAGRTPAAKAKEPKAEKPMVAAAALADVTSLFAGLLPIFGSGRSK